LIHQEITERIYLAKHWALKQTAIKPVEEYLNQYSHIISPMDTVVAYSLDKVVNR
jgi:hypothetical protein